jgi:hypothetical protein
MCSDPKCRAVMWELEDAVIMLATAISWGKERPSFVGEALERWNKAVVAAGGPIDKEHYPTNLTP